MTPRERLQLAYELAFCPWRLNGKWRGWVADPASADPDELRALDDAARLHLPLPQRPVSSTRALYRLARFQAESCAYRMRTFIGNVRRALNRAEISETEVPVGMVRDVALPLFQRRSGRRSPIPSPSAAATRASFWAETESCRMTGGEEMV